MNNNKKITTFIEDLKKKYPRTFNFSSAQLMEVCFDNKNLPQNQADIYFLISIMVVKGIFIKQKQGQYDLDLNCFLGWRGKL